MYKKINLLFLLATLAGCATIHQDKTPELKLISYQEFNTQTQFRGKPFGGLSGIVFDKDKNVFYAISDDRSQYAPARFYILKMTANKPLQFSIEDMIYLKDEKGNHYKSGAVDFEGITLLPNGNILLSSESIEAEKGNIPPRLMEFNRKGKFIKNWAVPDKFFYRQDLGVRENKSFESLIYDGDQVYTAVENALVEDGPEPDYQMPSNLRVLRYSAKGNYYTPCKQFVYPLSALPVNSKNMKGDMGLVELLTYQDGFLALERSFIYSLKQNVIQLFYFTEENSVTMRDSLKNYKYTGQKTLVFDFAHLGIRLDNIEGMSWGPILDNGHKTLVFVSDNNFNRKQRTLFLLFEVVP